MGRLTLEKSNEIMSSKSGKDMLEINNRIGLLSGYPNCFYLDDYRIDLEINGYEIQQKQEEILFAGWRLFSFQIRKPIKKTYYIKKTKFYKDRVIFFNLENEDIIAKIKEYLNQRIESNKPKIDYTVYADAEYERDNTLSYEEWDKLYGRVAY